MTIAVTGAMAGSPSRRVWTTWAAGFALSGVAHGMLTVLVIASLDAHGAAAPWIAVAAAARLLPYVVCSPFAGVLADRQAIGRVFATSLATRMLLVFGVWLASAEGADEWLPIGLLFLFGAAGTPCYLALLRHTREQVEHGQRARASRLIITLESAVFVAGPAMGGMALIVANVSFGLASVLALLGAAALLSTRSRGARSIVARRSDRDPRGMTLVNAWSGLFEPNARVALFATLTINVLAGLQAALLPRMVRDASLLGGSSYGLLNAAIGGGALVALFIAVRGRTSSSPPLRALLAAGGSAMCGMAVGGPIAVMSAGAFGASVVLTEIVALQLLHETAPEAAVGTTFGILDALLVAAMIVGTLAAPALTEVADESGGMLIAGSVACALALSLGRPARQWAPTSAPMTQTVHHPSQSVV